MDDSITISEALTAALPAGVIQRAIRRYRQGHWGRCTPADHADHAFRSDGLLLVACYRYRGQRFHLVTNEDRTLNRLQLASE